MLFCRPTGRATESLAVPSHDSERCDRALVPVLNFPQDHFNILANRAFARAGVDNRNHRWRDLVGEVPSFSALPRRWY
jgi:hypothetical protein